MKKYLVLVLGMMLTFALATTSWAAYDLKISDQTKAKIGFKGVWWIQMLDNGAPDGKAYETDFNARTFRWWVNGQITPLVKFMANMDFANGVRDGKNRTGGSLTDAAVTFDFAPEAKIMLGVFRVPFSRAALQDSFQYILVHAPDTVADGDYTGTANYRQPGIAFWGEAINKKLSYKLAVFDGSSSPAIGLLDMSNNKKDSPWFAGRVAVSLLDPETGWGNAGTYLGKKKVFTVGAGYVYSKFQALAETDTVLTADLVTGIVSESGGETIDLGEYKYTAYTVDAFLDMPLGGGALTLEAAYFKYKVDKSLWDADGYYAQVAYLIPGTNLQPAFRYDTCDWKYHDVGNDKDAKRWVAGLTYYIKGQAAKVAFEYSNLEYEKEGDSGRDKSPKDMVLSVTLQF